MDRRLSVLFESLGNPAKVRRMLAAKGGSALVLMRRDEDGANPLMAAVKGNHVKAIEHLLAVRGTVYEQISCQDNMGQTPFSIYPKNMDMRRLMVDKARSDFMGAEGWNGVMLDFTYGTADTLQQQLSGRSDEEVMELVRRTGPLGKHALSCAALYGNVKVIEQLLALPEATVMAQLMHASNSDEYIALTYTGTVNHARAATALLKVAPREQLLYATPRRGQTALIYAALTGSTDVVHELLKFEAREQVLHVRKDGHTALTIAVSENHVGIVEAIIRAACTAARQVVTHRGCVAMTMAAYNGYREIAELLLSVKNSEKEQVMAVDKCGHTPLMLAVMNGRMSVVELLLSVHDTVEEQVLHACSSSGNTALCIAAESGNVCAARMLLKVSPRRQVLHSRSDGHTALSLAIKCGHVDVFRELFAVSTRSQMLHNGDLALSLALEQGHADMFTALVVARIKAARSARCARCGTGGVPMRKCDRCRAARYCSKECQVAHWRHGGHKHMCEAKDSSS